MNVAYHFGLLLLIFGGVLALNSTGLFSSVGIGTSFIGVFVGILGLLQSRLSESE